MGWGCPCLGQGVLAVPLWAGASPLLVRCVPVWVWGVVPVWVGGCPCLVSGGHPCLGWGCPRVGPGGLSLCGVGASQFGSGGCPHLGHPRLDPGGCPRVGWGCPCVGSGGCPHLGLGVSPCPPACRPRSCTAASSARTASPSTTSARSRGTGSPRTQVGLGLRGGHPTGIPPPPPRCPLCVSPPHPLRGLGGVPNPTPPVQVPCATCCGRTRSRR